MTAWAAIDCDIDSHAKLAELPGDTARYGWIRTLLEAKRQRRPGRFASAAHFRHVLGRHGRFLKEYLAAKLLEMEGDEVVVHDWKRHQWASSKSLQRETSRGHSEDNDETSVGHELDASRAVLVDVPVYVSNDGERVQGEGDDEPWLHSWLLVRRRMPTAGQRRVIDSFLEAFDVSGPERLSRLILDHPDDPLDAVLKELKAFRQERLGEAQRAEVVPVRRPHRSSKMDPVGDELKRLWVEQGRYPEPVA